MLSLSVAAMYCSGTWNLNQFYDVGEVYDISSQPRDFTNVRYDSEKSCYVIEDVAAEISYTVYCKELALNYFCIYAMEIDGDGLETVVRFYDEDNLLLCEQSMLLKNGRNEWKLENQEIEWLSFSFADEQDASFRFVRLQLWERLPYYSWKTFGIVSLLLFAIYCLAIMFLRRVFAERIGRHRDKAWQTGIQRIYKKAFHNIGAAVERIGEEKRHWLRIVVLSLIFIVSFLYTKYLYMGKQYKYYIVCQLFLLILWSCLTMKRKMKIFRWSGGMLTLWSGMSLLMCVSDLFVEKKNFPYTGLWMILVFGLVFWSWANAADRIGLLRELATAVEIAFFFSLFSSILLEPYLGNNAYMGNTRNPNTLGNCQAIAVAVLVSQAMDLFTHEKAQRKLLWKATEMVAAITMINLSGCRSAQLVVVVMIVMLPVAMFRERFRKNYIRNALLFLGMSVLLFVPVNFGITWVAMHIPTGQMYETVTSQAEVIEVQTAHIESGTQELDMEAMQSISGLYDEVDRWSGGQLAKEITWSAKHLTSGQVNDGKTSQIGVAEVRDADMESHTQELDMEAYVERVWLYDKMNEWSTGRLTIWTACVKNMNLWGHPGRVEYYFDGKAYALEAHNMLLMISYRYGVITGCFYFALWLCVLWGGYRYARKARHGLRFMPWNITIACLVTMLLDNMEQPLRYLPWLVFYFLLGFYAAEQISGEKKENEKTYKIKGNN